MANRLVHTYEATDGDVYEVHEHLNGLCSVYHLTGHGIEGLATGLSAGEALAMLVRMDADHCVDAPDMPPGWDDAPG